MGFGPNYVDPVRKKEKDEQKRRKSQSTIAFTVESARKSVSAIAGLFQRKQSNNVLNNHHQNANNNNEDFKVSVV